MIIDGNAKKNFGPSSLIDFRTTRVNRVGVEGVRGVSARHFRTHNEASEIPIRKAPEPRKKSHVAKRIPNLRNNPENSIIIVEKMNNNLEKIMI